MEDKKGLQPLLDGGFWQDQLLVKLVTNRKGSPRKPFSGNRRAEKAAKIALAKYQRK